MAEKSMKSVLKEIFPKIVVKDILDYYNVHYEPKGDEFVVSCMFHEITRGKADRNPSLSINANKKLYNCLSCPAQGNIYQLVMQLEINSGKKSCSFIGAVKKICEINKIEFDGIFKVSKDDFNEDMSVDDLALEENQIQEVFNDNILKKYYLKTHNYFLDRGFKEQTLKEFEMGFGTSGVDKDRCIFPIRNVYGGLVGWTGRAVLSKMKPKWLHRPTDRFFKALNLFNINRAISYILKSNTVYVVESVGNCMRLWELGIKNVVAILGNKISEIQIEMLLGYANNIYFVFDNDDGGYDGIEVAINQLYDKDANVFFAQYDFGCDEKGYAYDIADIKYVSDKQILNEITYVEINQYMDENRGVMKMLDNIDLTEPVEIQLEDTTVVLTEELDKKCEYPQLVIEDILYVKRINSLFKVTGLEIEQALPF